MKRSDMLTLISDAIKPCNSMHKSSRDKAAERILDAIEEAGMVPPIAMLSSLGVSDNAWEPEDKEETCGMCTKACGQDWCPTRIKDDK